MKKHTVNINACFIYLASFSFRNTCRCLVFLLRFLLGCPCFSIMKILPILAVGVDTYSPTCLRSPCYPNMCSELMSLSVNSLWTELTLGFLPWNIKSIQHSIRRRKVLNLLKSKRAYCSPSRNSSQK